MVSPRAPDPGSDTRTHYPELEGHRGLAVLAVVMFTVYQFCNVDHFLYRGTPGYTILGSLDAAFPWLFVLTGFLLFEPVARSVVDGREPVGVREFLGRRVVRLLPVYVVAVSVVWFLRQRSLPGDWRDIVEHLTFTQVFDPTRIFYTIGPAWAVSVTVYFCLLLAPLTGALTRVGRRLPTRAGRVVGLATAAAALGAVSLAWRWWSFAVGHRSTVGSFTTWFGPMANLDDFALGMAVAVLVAALGGNRSLGPRGRLTLRAAGLAVLAVAFITRRAEGWSGVYFPSVCSAGFACLVAAAVLGTGGDRWSRVMASRALRGLGVISFSVFLWHEPIMLALRGAPDLVRQSPTAFPQDAIVVLTVSVVAGWLSHLLVQRPTGQLAVIFRRRRPAVLPSGSAEDERRDGSARSGAAGTSANPCAADT